MKLSVFSLKPASLVADIVLLVYAELVIYGILAEGGWLVKGMSIDMLLLFGIAIDFFLLWQMGLITVSYFQSDARRQKKPWFFPVAALAGCLAVWVFFALHFTVFFASFEAVGKGKDFFEILPRFFPFGTAMVMVGLGGGGIWGWLEYKRAQGINTRVERWTVAGRLFPVGLGLIVLYAAVVITENFFAGAALAIVFLIGMVKLFKQLRKKAENTEKEVKQYKFFYNIIFPLIVFTLLCVWTEILLLSKLNGGEEISRTGLFFYLLVTGVVPMRLLLAFQPPFRLAGLLTGGFSLWYFLSGILRLAG